MTRKVVLGLGVALLTFGLLGSDAEAKSKKGEMTLRILADFSTFDTSTPGAGGGVPFYVQGDICEDPTLGEGCTPIGDFHCWGWIPPSGVGLVSQEYNLFGRGKIQTQGLEDEGPRAVVGGTGDFSKVRGQATGVDLSSFDATGEFIIDFKLIGAKK